jgi:hypothetical protein
MSMSNQLSDKRVHNDDYEVNHNIADETCYGFGPPHGFLSLQIGGSSLNMESG